jgi:leader peptidase (prepilin peptidase)/N-methyltransferase
MLLAFALVFVFVVGASIGSFLNVAIARLPLEKSLLWPNSRCGACLQPIQWYDNIPLISYLWLRGRCRTCGQSYSILYFLIELGTALSFVALFWLEVVEDVHEWRPTAARTFQPGIFSGSLWIGFAWHATLFSFLLVASVCDLQSREIPLPLTLTGTLVGLIGSIFLPWPWPYTTMAATPPPLPLRPFDLAMAWQTPSHGLLHGIYPWPFWGPLPGWFEPGDNWQTGLATGIIGALVGTFLLRTIGFLFSTGLGKEALGLGDADLMMMAGSFLGWQIVVVAFFLSVIPALFIGMIQLVVRRDNSLPFGPSLSLSVMVTCLAWHSICEPLRPIFFSGTWLFWLVVLCAGFLLFASFVLRLLRRGE